LRRCSGRWKNFRLPLTELNLNSVDSGYSTTDETYQTDNERTEMSSQDPGSDAAHQEDLPQGTDRENDAVASKLSKELSNWRRRRTNGRPRRNEGERVNYQTESARTIKLRGHETLVVRKPRLVKPAVNQRPNQ
jgi:hypothetical protein